MERELKLRLDPANAAALRAAAPLASVRFDRRRMLATYFDTPEGELAAARFGLRLRREGGRWRQTLKAPGDGGTGLHERPEWDFPAAPHCLDLSRFAGTPLARLEGAEALHERLAAAFSVDMRRTRWHLAPGPGRALEVSLDEGVVRAGDREDGFCELEIECLEGEAEDAFVLAEALVAAVPMLPTRVTKAERGTRLARGAPWASTKAVAPGLAPGSTLEEGARAVVGAALGHWHANQEGLLVADDPEFVHQARVALRRLRSALRTFRDVPGRERADAWRSTLGDVARGLGEARDWDVFALEVLPRLVAVGGTTAAVPYDEARVDARRGEAREAARRAVATGPCGATLLAIAHWLAAAEPAPANAPLAPLAARVLRQRHRRLMRDSVHLAHVSPEERHRVRIDAKRLRYSADALASLFPAEKAARYVAALADLQDVLGQANDAVTALRLLPEAGADAGFEAFARGWLSAHAAPDPDHLALLRQRLADAPSFWKQGG